MRRYFAYIVGAGVFLTSCSSNGEILGEIVGEKMLIDAEVYFVNQDKTPAADEKVYIVEQVGVNLITEVRQTDHLGRVALRGRYCTPTIVAANGGAMVIRKDNLKKTFTVTLSEDRTPTLASGYGVPLPNISTLKQSTAYQNCGPE